MLERSITTTSNKVDVLHPETEHTNHSGMERAGSMGKDSVKFTFTSAAVKYSFGVDLSLTCIACGFLILYKKKLCILPIFTKVILCFSFRFCEN